MILPMNHPPTEQIYLEQPAPSCQDIPRNEGDET